MKITKCHPTEGRGRFEEIDFGTDVRFRLSFIPCWWQYKMCAVALKKVWQSHKVLDVPLPCDPAVTFLSVCLSQRNGKLVSLKNPHMNIHSSFIRNSKSQKQPRHLHLGEGLKRLYILTAEHSSGNSVIGRKTDTGNTWHGSQKRVLWASNCCVLGLLQGPCPPCASWPPRYCAVVCQIYPWGNRTEGPQDPLYSLHIPVDP